MKYLRFFEKSIGIEEIWKKWYSDIDKKLFFKIVNVDPTAVRKTNFSKPGKYIKWLIREYKNRQNGNSDGLWIMDLTKSDDKVYKRLYEQLNYYLFIFSTGWFKNKVKKNKYFIGGELYSIDDSIGVDILKYSYKEFINMMDNYVDEYKSDTEESKYDVVYSDNNLDVLVPLNFSGSYETAKNTEWCTKSKGAYDTWNGMAILFRILPKKSGYDKLKLTWLKDLEWNIACSKYPEIGGEGNPFEKINGEFKWEISCREFLYKNSNNTYGRVEIGEIKKTMELLNDNCRQFIVDYYYKKIED